MNPTLYQAIETENLIALEELSLQKHGGLDWGFWENGVLRRPLDKAVELKKYAVVNFLLQKGIHPLGGGDQQGWDAVAVAIHQQDAKALGLLLQSLQTHSRFAWKGIGSKGKDYVRWAVSQQSHACLRLLLKAGANANGQTFSSPSKRWGAPRSSHWQAPLSPLQSAIRTKDWISFEILIQSAVTLPWKEMVKQTKVTSLQEVWRRLPASLQQTEAPYLWRAGLEQGSELALKWILKTISPLLDSSNIDQGMQFYFEKSQARHLVFILRWANSYQPTLDSLNVWHASFQEERILDPEAFQQAYEWFAGQGLSHAISSTWWERCNAQYSKPSLVFFEWLHQTAPSSWNAFCQRKESLQLLLHHFDEAPWIEWWKDTAKIEDQTEALDYVKLGLRAWTEHTGEMEAKRWIQALHKLHDHLGCHYEDLFQGTPQDVFSSKIHLYREPSAWMALMQAFEAIEAPITLDFFEYMETFIQKRAQTGNASIKDLQTVDLMLVNALHWSLSIEQVKQAVKHHALFSSVSFETSFPLSHALLLKNTLQTSLPETFSSHVFKKHL